MWEGEPERGYKCVTSRNIAITVKRSLPWTINPRRNKSLPVYYTYVSFSFIFTRCIKTHIKFTRFFFYRLVSINIFSLNICLSLKSSVWLKIQFTFKTICPRIAEYAKRFVDVSIANNKKRKMIIFYTCIHSDFKSAAERTTEFVGPLVRCIQKISFHFYNVKLFLCQNQFCFLTFVLGSFKADILTFSHHLIIWEREREHSLHNGKSGERFGRCVITGKSYLTYQTEHH